MFEAGKPMPDDKKFAHIWQEIAANASKETDPKKLQKLAEKLNHALLDLQKKTPDKRDAA